MTNCNSNQKAKEGSPGITPELTMPKIKRPINMAIKLGNGETIEAGKTVANGTVDVPAVLLTPYVVTQENLQELLVDSGYISADDIK